MLYLITKYKVQLAGVVALVLLIASVQCYQLWQPARQVELHQQHLLEAAQERKWRWLASFFAEDFRTPLGQDRAWALNQSSEVLRQFMDLQLRASQTETALNGDTARVSCLIRVDGSGMPLAEMAKNAVNGSSDPFEFTWKHKSWLPWDWKLVSVDHPLIHSRGEM